MLRKGNTLPRDVLPFPQMEHGARRRIDSLFGVGDRAMRSSRARSRLTAAALAFLVAMTSGCLCPRARRINPIGEWIRVKPPAVSTITQMRCTDQCATTGWQVRHGIVETPTAALKPNGAQSVDPLTDNAGEPKAGVRPDAMATPSGLRIHVVDLTDPVPQGDQLTYKIIVSNDGAVSQRNVSVVAIVPRGMIPLNMDTREPSGRTVTGQIVRFDSIAELRPGQRREYQVAVQTQRTGQLVFRVEVTSDNLPESLGAEATTEVIP